MSFVIDASLALSWFFEDEQTMSGMKLLEQVALTGALVPGHWRLEMANALQMSMRRGRVNKSFRGDALHRLANFPIEVDSETDAVAWQGTLTLADRHQLTVYDAAYLELALRRGLPIATRDQQLARAAKDSGVKALPTD